MPCARNAAADGGIKFVEITFSVPGALDVIKELTRRGDIHVGAGTVLASQQAERAIGVGAEFIVSPSLELNLVGICHTANIACFPGAATPTEIIAAQRAHADLVKIFPGGFGRRAVFHPSDAGAVSRRALHGVGRRESRRTFKNMFKPASPVFVSAAPILAACWRRRARSYSSKRCNNSSSWSPRRRARISTQESAANEESPSHAGMRRLRPHAAAQRRHRQARRHRAQLYGHAGGGNFLAHDEVRRVRRLRTVHGSVFDRGVARPPALRGDSGVSVAHLSPPLYIRQYRFGYQIHSGLARPAHGRAGVFHDRGGVAARHVRA